MFLRRTATWRLATLVVAFAGACGGSSNSGRLGSDASSACSIGAETCTCTTGGACNAGLTCASNLCVRLPDAAAGSSSSSGATGPDATMSSSGSSGGATSSSSGGSGSSSGSADDGPSADGEVGTTEDGATCAQTTLTGKVFDPAGVLPLPGVSVFVPASPPPAFVSGTSSCAACPSPSNYVAIATTDATGTFTLSGVPVGSSVPLVAQIGKWRRQITVSVANRCGTNSVSDGLLVLPHNHTLGDIPQMAVVTGGADDLGCFLREIGLDDAEYGAPQAGGRLDVYEGVDGPGLSTGTAGDCTSSTCPLWASKPALEKYDLVLLACEGSENAQTKPANSVQFMHDWLGEGGKVFATHFQYYWFKDGPADFENVATWTGFSSGSGSGTYTVETSTAAGRVFDQWLVSPAVNAATDAGIPLNAVANSVSAVSANATPWIVDPSTSYPKYLSFATPLPSGDASTSACGRAVFTDLHTAGAPSGAVPGSCPSALTPQEKALEYLFFNLSACEGP